eukprot:SAG31_NODE_3135_length_4636_cov_7.918448_6_plen_237_part_00
MTVLDDYYSAVAGDPSQMLEKLRLSVEQYKKEENQLAANLLGYLGTVCIAMWPEYFICSVLATGKNFCCKGLTLAGLDGRVYSICIIAMVLVTTGLGAHQMATTTGYWGTTYFDEQKFLLIWTFKAYQSLLWKYWFGVFHDHDSGAYFQTAATISYTITFGHHFLAEIWSQIRLFCIFLGVAALDVVVAVAIAVATISRCSCSWLCDVAGSDAAWLPLANSTCSLMLCSQSSQVES